MANSSIDLDILSNFINVKLNLSKEKKFGITVVGQFYSNGENGGIFVNSIANGSVVKEDGRIDVGDMIIQVNDVNFVDRNLTNDEAIDVLRREASKLGPINLVVVKHNLLNKLEFERDLKNKPILDKQFQISKWIDQAIERTKKMVEKDINSEVDINNIQLTTKTDMLSIARIMSASESGGLEIKDRIWFKLVFSNSFLGSDVVDWLLNNVDGFDNRKEAKKYANNMLKNNYIKHPLNKNNSFSENCYYVFSESVERIYPSIENIKD